MSVLINQSTCFDCEGRATCQRFKRLNPSSIRDDLIQTFKTDSLSCKVIESREGRPKEIFEVVIQNCSMKSQCANRKKFRLHDVTNPLKYCKLCQTMHQENSKIGVLHAKHLG